MSWAYRQNSSDPTEWKTAAWMKTGAYVPKRRLQNTDSNGTSKPLRHAKRVNCSGCRMDALGPTLAPNGQLTRLPHGAGSCSRSRTEARRSARTQLHSQHARALNVVCCSQVGAAHQEFPMLLPTAFRVAVSAPPTSIMFWLKPAWLHSPHTLSALMHRAAIGAEVPEEDRQGRH